MSHKRFFAIMLSTPWNGPPSSASVEPPVSDNRVPHIIRKTSGPESENRFVTVKWLKEKLLDEEGVADIPVELSNAIIVGTEDAPELDLSNTTFRRDFAITESEFRCKVNFSFAVFEQSVNFTASRFADGVDFRAARVKCDLTVTRARFDKYACFDDLDVGEAFRAEGADFRQADFNRICLHKNALFCSALVAVGKDDCRLIRTRFRSRADFTDAHIQGSAYFKGVSFGERAIFDRIRIDGSAFFDCDLYHDGKGEEDERSDNLQFKRQKMKPTFAPVRGHRRPLRVISFRGKASFIGARFGSSVSFSGAQFMDDADFRRAQIEGTAIFENYSSSAGARPIFIPTRFRKDALFWMLKVKGAAKFHAAQFRGKADFEHAQIGGRAYFNAVSYGGGVVSPRFSREAKFLGAHVKGTSVFVGAVFGGDAVFEHFHTDVSVLFRSAEYRKEKDVAAKFAARQAGKDADARRLPDEELVMGITPRQARDVAERLGPPDILREIRETPAPVFFNGKADFLAVRVQGNAEFDGAHFAKVANFERAQIGGALHFRPENADADPICFHGPAIFQGAVVKGNAQFSGTKFRDRAEFKAMLFEGSVYFDCCLHFEDGEPAGGADASPRPKITAGGVRFQGPVHFSGARFKNQANFTGAQFDRKAHFTNAVVEGMASFQGAAFKGATSFRGAHFNIVKFRETPVENPAPNPTPPAPDDTRKGRFRTWLDRHKARVKAKAGSPTDILRTSFSEREGLDLRGFTYQQIEVVLEDILDGMDNNGHSIPFERQPYVQLEKTYRAVGDDYRAGDVYHKLRWREHWEGWRQSRRNGWRLLDNLLHRQSKKEFVRQAVHELVRVIGLLFDLVFLGGLARYGIRPFRLLLISAGFLCAGTYFFSQPGAVAPKTPSATDRDAAQQSLQKLLQQPTPTPQEIDLSRTQAFGVSLNQFIPVLEVPSGNRWRPSEKLMVVPLTDDQCNPDSETSSGCRFRYLSYAFYGTIHRLFGFILVPLGLAALTGLLHRREKASGKS